VASLREREDEGVDVVRLLRAGASIAVVLFAAAVFGGLPSPGTAALEPMLEYAAALVAAIVFAAMTFAGSFPRYRNFATLVFCTCLVLIFARISSVTGSAQPRLLALVLCPLAASSLAQWGPRWQGGLNVICLVAFVTSKIADPLNDPYAGASWLWMLASIVIAQAIATFLDRQDQRRRAQRERTESEAYRRERESAEIAHDIRSPLAALNGFLSLLQDGGLAEQERQAVLSRMRAAARRMELLVENILTLDRIDNGRLSVTNADLVPDAIAAEVVRGYAEEAKTKGVSIVAELGCEGQANLDRAHLERILANLLANALARSKAGEIRLKTARAAGWLQIEVSDGAPALSDDSRLFARPAPYESSSGANQLGLHIARALVEASGGRIEASSLSGEGLRVSAEIPLARR
jgi:signal transduction histidine kinase